MYFLTVSRLTAPTVLMNAERVHRHGSFVFSSGYICLSSCEVYPFSLCIVTVIASFVGLTSSSRCT